jgi:tRNA(Arg) A34 adenosine deaminase TadA
MNYAITAIIRDKRGRILSIGRNSYIKTHPLQARLAQQAGKSYCVYLHAEIHAITRLRHGVPHSIHVFRYYADGTPANSKPCEICQQAIKLAGIQKIYHT